MKGKERNRQKKREGKRGLEEYTYCIRGTFGVEPLTHTHTAECVKVWVFDRQLLTQPI